MEGADDTSDNELSWSNGSSSSAYSSVSEEISEIVGMMGETPTLEEIDFDELEEEAAGASDDIISPHWLIIYGLHPETTEEAVIEAFQRYGDVAGVVQSRKGINFVYFSEEMDCQNAYENTVDVVIDGRRVKVFVSSFSEQTAPQLEWKKILYRKQPYLDNYVDERFLEDLKTNVGLVKFNYWKLVKDSAVVSQQISSVVLLALVFNMVYKQMFNSVQLVLMLFAFYFFGYVFFVVLKALKPSDSQLDAIDVLPYPGRASFGMFVIFGALFGFSQVLGTLTVQFSTDTIWALSILLLATHLVSHNWSTTMGGAISLNAGFCATILMASRLFTIFQVYFFLSFSVFMLSLFPLFRHIIREIYPLGFTILTWLLFLVNLSLLYVFSSALFGLYAALILGLTFVAPLSLISVQQYKMTMSGPWDEVKPKINFFD